MSVLEARDLTRRYGEMTTVADAGLSLEGGRITALLGPSGCGKSTLLRMIAGLERPDAGEVWAGGRLLSGPGVFVPPEQRDIGFVFQDYALFPHLSVEKNVAFGLAALKPAERKARTMEQLGRVRMADRRGDYPQALSGGEQQRVALARTLARQPAVVLLDEPFSGLDGRLKAEVREATLAALRASGAAALIVTHDAEEAMMMADDLALMRAGRILQTGTARDCYLDPASPEAARLLGDTVELRAERANGQAVTAFGRLPAQGEGPVLVVARPEAFRIAPADSAGAVDAQVTRVSFGGPFVLADVTAGGQCAVARIPLAQAPAVGERLRLRLEPSFCKVFEAR